MNSNSHLPAPAFVGGRRTYSAEPNRTDAIQVALFTASDYRAEVNNEPGLFTGNEPDLFATLAV